MSYFSWDIENKLPMQEFETEMEAQAYCNKLNAEEPNKYKVVKANSSIGLLIQERK